MTGAIRSLKEGPTSGPQNGVNADAPLDSRAAAAGSLPPEVVRRRRIQLLLLALVFFGPVAVSFFLYYATDWRPAGRVNHGELLQPVRLLPEVALPTPSGVATGPGFLRGRWTLLHFAGASCDAACQATLADSRAVRLGLDRDATRVQRVLLGRPGCCEPATLAAANPDLQRVSLEGPDAERLLAEFPSLGGLAPLDSGRVWLVDPNGVLVLSWAPGTEKKDMVQDLEKLLKLSRIG